MLALYLLGCCWMLTVTAQLGLPGMPVVPDRYNSYGFPWNRTYLPTEPQQIHLSITAQGESAKIQFATHQPIQTAFLKYWSKNSSILLNISHDWIFVDDGNAKRATYLHNVQTQSLTPDTRYRYQVGSVANSLTLWSAEFEFNTPSSQDDFKFLAIGDLGVNNAVTMEQLVKRTSHYDFFALTGDQAYDLSDFDGTKGDQYMNFVQPLFASLPYLGVVGNHETAFNYSHYKNRFNIVPFQESNSIDPLFYSINYKSLHLISFSSEFYFDSNAQKKYPLDWLEADLDLANRRRHLQPWIVFMTHRPLYCSGNSPSCHMPSELSSLEPILLKHKVDMYMSGHVHNYERTYPMYNSTLQTQSYENAPTFFQLVIGNAGQPEGPSDFLPGDPPPWSANRFSGYGFTEFKVSLSELELTHLSVNTDGSLGKVVDHVVVSKTK